jgi:hypothetical protein
LGVRRDFPKLQSSIAGIKTPCIGAFLYHWKTIKAKMLKMGLHEPFGHLQHKLWQKKKPKVKLAI